MKTGWTEVRLGDVAAVNPKGDRLSPDTAVAFVPMTALDAVSGQTLETETRPFKAVSKGYSQFRRDDLLVAKITPCFENGKTGRATILHDQGAGSTEFHVVRPDPARLDASYALHLLRSDRVRRTGALRMTGSAGQRRVPEQFLSALSVPLPPLEEQRRIARVLDVVNEVRAKRTRSIERAADLAGAMYAQLFGAADAEGAVPLGDIAETASGITKGRRIEGQRLAEVPYLAVSNVQDGHLDLTKVKQIAASEAEIDRYRLEPDDLLLTEGGDPDKLGRGTLWAGELEVCIHQNHVFRVRVRDRGAVDPMFLKAQVASPRARRYFLRAAKQTTGIASINLTQLRALPVQLPPISSQRRFAQQVLASVRTDAARIRHREQLDALAASLQCRAFGRRALNCPRHAKFEGGRGAARFGHAAFRNAGGHERRAQKRRAIRARRAFTRGALWNSPSTGSTTLIAL